MSEKNEWKLVPVEPTPEMEQAAADFLGVCVKAHGLWAAMLAAAPGSPASTVATEGEKDEAIGTLSRNADETIRFTPARDFHVKDGMPVFSAPAAGDALGAPAPEWMACGSRRPWVTNSLRDSAQKLRDKERRCRTAYSKDFYGIPARYVADAYAEAAAVFEARLAAIAQQSQRKEA